CIDVLRAARIQLPESEIQTKGAWPLPVISGFAPGAVAHALDRANIGEYQFPRAGTMDVGLNGPILTPEQFTQWGGLPALP
ncbi:MAG TPA: hypothetical protein PLO50_15785, partial [Nitrospira sp.]|nr:hypothetical protein [Nitrospira sp.]